MDSSLCASEWDDCEAWGREEVLRTRPWSALDRWPPYVPLGVCADPGGCCDEWTTEEE